MISLAWPWLLLLLPLPLLVYWLPKKSQNRVSAALIVPEILSGSTVSTAAQDNNKSPLIMLSLCWLLSVVALSQPQWLGFPLKVVK